VTKSGAAVIVGSGPAGLSAAVELARHDVDCVLLDDAARVGGVVYRGPLRATTSPPAHLGKGYLRAFERLHGRYVEHGNRIETRLRTRVVGVSDGDRLCALDERGRLLAWRFSELILATGCHERSVPFPGWTLPGVMLLGGMQLQIKSALVKPREPVVIAGSGPLLPLVACQLTRAGVRVEGVYEAAPLRNFTREAWALLHQPALFLEGLGMLAYLKMRGVPVHYGWGIVEAHGTQALDAVTVAPYDGEWFPRGDRQRRIAAGALAVGYGFVPRIQLSGLLGLEHAIGSDGTRAPLVDEWQQSSRENIYVAGDSAGIQGREAAALQGKIAALGVLKRRGVIDAGTAERERRVHAKGLQAMKRFRAGIAGACAPGPGLASLPDAATLICRCENVTRGDVDAAIEQGVQDMTSLKMRCRVGMGDCQGKMCLPYCTDRLRRATQRPDVGTIRPRFPLEPLPFAALAGAREPS
jgi:hydrogen cyanide synthase HcnB